MKESNIIVVFILVFLIVPLSGTSQSIPEQQITGDWVFNFEASLELMDENARLHYENMNANGQVNLQQAYQNRRMTFGEDGVFSQELANGRNVEGSWNFGKGNSIDISSSTGYIISFKIKWIDKITLILIPVKSDENTANMLFSQWYLMKG